jgi:hypothetical protein
MNSSLSLVSSTAISLLLEGTDDGLIPYLRPRPIASFIRHMPSLVRTGFTFSLLGLLPFHPRIEMECCPGYLLLKPGQDYKGGEPYASMHIQKSLSRSGTLKIGADWLHTLGPVTMDFKELQMSFTKEGRIDKLI